MLNQKKNMKKKWKCKRVKRLRGTFMSFNVKVIGCSTAWTNRPMSSYCLDDEILIDCGEGTTKYYDKTDVNFNSIKNIFITHFHSDHFSGLTQYLCQHCLYCDKSQWTLILSN